MQEMEIMKIFRETGAYEQGHFKLSSGLHSGGYLQCAKVLQYPTIAARFSSVLATKFEADEPDVVVGPALGGIVIAYELARALGIRALFTERDAAGEMRLRRGFVIPPDSKVLIAEDVLTTGKSVREIMSILIKDGIKPIGVACIVDRSREKLDIGVRCESLIRLNIPAFVEGSCPLCQEGLPIVKPGSRM
jgi:orotate phosphoribosyltransferase